MVISTISNKDFKYNYLIHPNSIEGIFQQCKLLLSTTRGTVPLERDFGIDSKAVDKPSNILTAGLKVDIQQQLKKFIPRATLLEVKTTSKNGAVEIHVTIGVKDE